MPGRPSAVATVEQSRLPRPVGGAATCWDGRYGYVLGGVVVETSLQPGGGRVVDEIVRFDPTSGSVTTLSSRLPTWLTNAVAVWDGTAAYLFGGRTDADGIWNRIVRFNPATGRSDVLPQVLPVRVTNAYAAWDGQHAYIVGGYGSSGTSGQSPASDRIIRFTPATGEVRTLSTRQPVLPREARGAVWDGRRILIPTDPSGPEAGLAAATVVAYDPVADTAATLPSTLPRLAGAQAIWACNQLLVFGVDTKPSPLRGPGSAPDQESLAVLSIDLNGGPAKAIGKLPPYRTGPIIWDGDTAWVLGGTDERASIPTTEIVRYGPPLR